MVVDLIDNYKLYSDFDDRFKKAFEFITNYIEKKLPDGKYDIYGDDIYATVSSYQTTEYERKKWESHERYIDIQYVAAGKEKIYWCNIKELIPCTEYNMQKDYTLYEGDNGVGVKLQDGYFIILFPQDAHMPACIYDESKEVTKIVVKVKVCC